MGRACSACIHPARDVIDRSLLERQPASRLAVRFGLSRFAVGRHERGHIAPALALAAQEREVARADDLVEKLADLDRTTLEILKEARDGKRPVLALKAIQRIEAQIELRARLLGQLRDRSVNVVNFNLDPEMGRQIAETFLQRHGREAALPAIEIGTG